MAWQVLLGYLCVCTLFLVSLLQVAYPVDVPPSAPVVSLVASGTLAILTTPLLLGVLLHA